ncbi:MAG TPA: cadherin repeat domain-containing protein [Flavobacteriaceae bacterium]|nr:cadherin repeat domain-containing protein [Flavobacteriaceae bacterium]
MNAQFIRFKTIFILLFTMLTFSCSKEDELDAGLQVSTTDVEFTVNEYPEPGQEIGTVPGSGNRGAVTFSIIEQSVEGAFAIETSTGKLKVEDPLVFIYNKNSFLIAKIKVANGSMFEIANVKVIINKLGIEKWHEGNVFLNSQNAIDEFGHEGYSHINGDLLIGSDFYNDIHDTGSLLALEKVTGSVHIWNCSHLAVLDGFQNVSEIGGGLYFGSNPELEKIEGFNQVSQLDFIVLEENWKLKNIQGFDRLSEVKHFECYDLHIPDFNTFSSLKKVTHLTIYYCPNIKSLEGLSGLDEIEETIYISSNDLLENIDALSNIRSSLKKMTISGNSSLKNINGFANIGVSEYVTIEDNERLENVDGLSNIRELMGITIRKNNFLHNLNGLSGLTKIGSSGILIHYNNLLEDLQPLSALEHIEGTLSVRNNVMLKDFCGLQSSLISSTPSGFEINGNAYNPSLEDIRNGNCAL